MDLSLRTAAYDKLLYSFYSIYIADTQNITIYDERSINGDIFSRWIYLC